MYLIMDLITLEKYKCAGKLSRSIINELMTKMFCGDFDSYYSIQKYSDKRIIEEINKVYKKEKNKGIGFPTTININNNVENFIYNKENDKSFNKDDVIKITLGVNIGGCVSIVGETFSNNKKSEELMNNIKRITEKLALSGETNDEIRMHIEAMCLESEYFPIENCISYQHLGSQIINDESKYIVCNYKAYCDLDGYLTTTDNTCFELLDGEVYTIKLQIINKDISPIIYSKDSSIVKFDDTYRELKLNMSKNFRNEAFSKYGLNSFNSDEYSQSYKHRAGMKDCINKELLYVFQHRYAKTENVYHKIFTLIVMDNKCVIIN